MHAVAYKWQISTLNALQTDCHGNS